MTQKSERPLGGSGRCGNQSLWGIIERPLYTADGAHPQEVERHRRAWLAQQVQFDLDALTRATGHLFDEWERRRFIDVQHQAQRWTFIGSGMSHPNFLTTVNAIAPDFHGRLLLPSSPNPLLRRKGRPP